MKFPEQYRWQDAPEPYATNPGDPFGAFRIPSPVTGRELHIIVADGEETGWDHVSISTHRNDRCPTWEEMCFVKSLFWEAEDCVVQFHPPESDYVNVHPGVLHLWRNIDAQFPMPPKICV